MDIDQQSHTFLSLFEWTTSVFDKAGFVIIKSQQGDMQKLEYYINSLGKLEVCLRIKAEQVIDEDKVNDLKIMAEKVTILKEYMEYHENKISSRIKTDNRTSVLDVSRGSGKFRKRPNMKYIPVDPIVGLGADFDGDIMYAFGPGP